MARRAEFVDRYFPHLDLLTDDQSKVIESLLENRNVINRRLEHMTEPELARYMNRLMGSVHEQRTPDTVGAMVIVFQEDKITQYAASIDPETSPDALRELADRIEARETVKRDGRLGL